jgi:TonB family protein
MNSRRIFAFAPIAVVIGWCAVCAAAQDSSQTEPPKIIRKAGGVLQGSAVTRVEPVYPPLAKAARVSGAVVVEVTVDEKGDVITAQAISGHPLLKDSAVAAARGWKFAPTELSGVPVKVIGTVTFNFSVPQEPRSGSATDNDIEMAKQAVKANAYSPEAHFKLAEAYVYEGTYEEAVESYKRAIELKPTYKEAYARLAFAYRNQNKRNEEVDTYKLAIAAMPKDVDLLNATARALTETERFAEAIDVQKRVTQLNPADSIAFNTLGSYQLRANRLQDALASFQESVRLNPKNAIAYHNVGWTYVRMGRWEDAIAAYTQLTSAVPDYNQMYRVYNEMGNAILRSRGANEALVEFNRALQMNPRYAPTHYNIGIACHIIGRYQEAADSFNKAIELQPRNSAYHINLGDVYQHLGRTEDAEKEFREAIKISPEIPQGYIELATLLFLQNKSDEVDSLVRKASEYMPKNVNGYSAVSSLLQHQGHPNEAEAALRKVLTIDPNNALALNNLGYAMVERNEKLEEALAMIQRAVKAEPKNAAYLDSLGWAYFKLDKLEEAERNLTEAAQFGASPVILDHLGDVFQKRGKSAQARDVWQKALMLRAGSQLSATIKAKLDALSNK